MSSFTVRVFVSSTFADFVAERDRLAELAYPALERVCRKYGATFQAVDLRWGISPDAGRDQQTLDLCLEELRRCQKASPRPNFIALVGDRYGWRPVPPRVPADEFDELAAAAPQRQELLRRWFSRDDNALPAEYRLGRITAADDWAGAEAALRVAFAEAMAALGWAADDPRRRKYETAVTHREILEGLLEAPPSPHEPGGHVFCYFRRAAGLPENAPPGGPARAFADYLPDGGRDEDARRRLGRLRQEIEARLPESNRQVFEGRWDGRRAVAGLEALCARVVADLSGVIEAELGGRVAVPAAVREREAHARFGEAARAGFTGQARPLGVIGGYLRAPEEAGPPLAVVGPPGAGKTALVAEASRLPTEGALTVVRYLGTTPASSSLGPLLADLCGHLDEELGAAGPLPADTAELVNEFRRRLADWPEGRRLVLVLDAIDQLGPEGGAHGLHWVPHELPGHVRLVLTMALAGEGGAALLEAARRVCGGRVFALAGLADGDPGALLDSWLAAGQTPRRLTAGQREAVLMRFQEHPLPLYLRLLAGLARRWTSATPTPPLPANSAAAAGAMFDRLEGEEDHGRRLVTAALGLLCASRRGLSEGEMLDLLAADEEVMAEFLRRSPTEQAKAPGERLRRLPPIVWSRLADELRPYLAERDVPGGRVLDFYHRDIRHAAEARYLPEERRAEAPRALARYFSSRPDFVAAGVPDGRKADELPYLLHAAGSHAELADTLAGEGALPFLEAKAAAGLVRELVEDLLLAATVAPVGHPRKAHLRLLAEAVRRHVAVLERSPGELFRCLWEECWWYDAPEAGAHYPAPEGGAPWEGTGPRLSSLLEVWLEGKRKAEPGLVWLRALRPPRTGLGALGAVVLRGHTDRVLGVAFSAEEPRAVSWSADGTVRVWGLNTGNEVRRIACAAEEAAYTLAGPRAVVVREGEAVEVLDVNTAAPLLRVPWPGAAVQQVALSPDGRYLAVAAYDVAGRAYFQPGAEAPVVVGEGEANEVLENALLRDGARVVPVTKGGFLGAWDVASGDWKFRLELEQLPIESLAFSPDGERLAFGAAGGDAFVVRVGGRDEVVELTGGRGRNRELVFAPDGSGLVAASWDGLWGWSLPEGGQGRQLLERLPARCRVAFRGQALVAAFPNDEGEVVAVDLRANKKVAHPAPQEMGWPYLSADGRWLAVSGYPPEVRVWALGQGETVARMPAAGGALSFSPDGSALVGPAGDGEQGRTVLGLWGAGTGAPLGPLGEVAGQPELLRFSPDGRHLVAATGKEYAVWEVAGRRLVARFPQPHHSQPPLAIEFRGDWLWLLAADPEVRLWKVGRPERPWRRLGGHREPVTAFAFSPDGARAAGGARDGAVSVWDVASGEQRVRLAAHEGRVSALAFSPDGGRLVTGGEDRAVRVWDAGTGEAICEGRHEDAVVSGRLDMGPYAAEGYRQLNGSHYMGGEVRAAAFSPDGLRVVSGSEDETVRVWDASSGEELACFRTLEGPDRKLIDHGAARAVAFLSDDSVVAVSSDRHLRVWNWRTGQRWQERELPARFKVAFSTRGAEFVGRASDAVYVGGSMLFFRPEKAEVPFGPDKALFSSDDSHVVAYDAGSGRGVAWAREGMRLAHEFTCAQGDVVAACVVGGELVLASAAQGSSPVRVFLKTGEAQPLDARAESVDVLRLSPDGWRFATRDWGTVRLHDADTGLVEWSRAWKEACDVCFLDNDRLALLDVKGSPLGVWDHTMGEERPPRADEVEQAARAVRLHPAGHSLRAWSSTLCLRPVADGVEANPPGEAGDGDAIRAGERWELLVGGKRLFLGEGPRALACGPGGRRWAVVEGRFWRLYAVEGGGG